MIHYNDPFIIGMVLGIVFGVFIGGLTALHQKTSKKENTKTRKTQKNPDYCACKEICQNNLCKNMPDECCYDTRPWE